MEDRKSIEGYREVARVGQFVDPVLIIIMMEDMTLRANTGRPSLKYLV